MPRAAHASPPFPAPLLSSHSDPSSSFSDSVPPPPWPALPALPALPWPLQGELQLLCVQLDRHINTHIRESPQAMYRTTLKDLAAQTHIRWQELLAHCQPQVVPPPQPPPGLEGEGSGQLTDQSPQSVCPSAAARLLAGRWGVRAVGGQRGTCILGGPPSFLPRVRRPGWGCSEGDTDKLTPG